MHLRISAVLCFAILAGFVSSTQTNTDRGKWSDNIDIDGELEGSGGGTEVSRDLEASGSGFGPDDEDSQDVESKPDNEITQPPPVIDKDQGRAALPEEETPKHKTNGPTFDNSGVTMSGTPDERHTSFFAQPGILAAVVGGAVVGLLCAILVVMFIVYRMRKKDEGSYPLDEQKRPSNPNYRGNNKEFYA